MTLNQKMILLASRKAGKTEVVSAAAYLEACLGGYALIISRSDRQAKRVIQRALAYHKHWKLVEDSKRPNEHEMNFVGGGRILALPASADTILGEHGVTLLIIDEAARVKDSLYGAVDPMLDVEHSKMVLLSTPQGRRGFFYEEWFGKRDSGWKRHRIVWQDCPRLTQKYVDNYMRKHGTILTAQEFSCVFHPLQGCMFDVTLLDDLIEDGEEDTTIDTW